MNNLDINKVRKKYKPKDSLNIQTSVRLNKSQYTFLKMAFGEKNISNGIRTLINNEIKSIKDYE